jgi:hypothetical protein
VEDNVKAGATARVQVTVEVDAGSSWGGDCTVEQIHKQAGEQAISLIHRHLNKERGFQIVGQPHVLAVLVARTP